MKITGATATDVTNVAAWVEVFENILMGLPDGTSAKVLECLLTRLAERPDFITFEALMGKDISHLTPARMRLSALVIQRLVRDIANENSPEDAFKIMFAHQPFGYGSRLLADYIPIGFVRSK